MAGCWGTSEASGPLVSKSLEIVWPVAGGTSAASGPLVSKSLLEMVWLVACRTSAESGSLPSEWPSSWAKHPRLSLGMEWLVSRGLTCRFAGGSSASPSSKVSANVSLKFASSVMSCWCGGLPGAGKLVKESNSVEDFSSAALFRTASSQDKADDPVSRKSIAAKTASPSKGCVS